MRDTHRETVTESYAFACLSCGHGWERTYRIEHHVDPLGHPFVLYFADEERVPSPLSRPRCPDCGGGRIRLMRSGLVERVEHALDRAPRPAPGKRI
ncbi:hypothetical protein FNQ90_16870 [Streptomyces alkaliphilus]|uniref:C2H2-type domain-containing protein n=1 Tax=Streptomyces alkaliphilus TaxID=1472722 RepID=A0A7W3TFS8_9ACTN|nr:hypothetical protein [Streptomyces alkaliphilus]